VAYQPIPKSQERARPWLPDASKQLDALAQLGSGWDGADAESPDREIVQSGSQILQALDWLSMIPKPHINPTPDGGVQFEWESGSRYFEIELFSPDAAKYSYADHDAKLEEKGEIPTRGSLAADTILRFISQVFPAH